MDQTPVAGPAMRAVRSAAPAARGRVETGLPPDEQLVYAKLLDVGMRIGLLLLLLTFSAYLLGVTEPHVPVRDLPRYWSLPVSKYLAATGAHGGWGWIRLLSRCDYLNFVGIAFLAGITIPCYLAIGVMFARKKDRAYAWLSAAEVLILGLAASGLLAAGGH